MTIKRIIGGKGCVTTINETPIIFSVEKNAGDRKIIKDIVDFDDSSVYSQVLGVPVLFTDVGDFNLTEELADKIKPYCEDGKVTPIDKLPEDIRKELEK